MATQVEEQTQTAGAHLSPERVLQLGLGFWGSKTLLSAVELDVFSVLADSPQDEETLRQRLELHPRSARDFLDALVALGMLERDRDVYRNTPETDLFLDRAKPSYVGGLLEMANARLYPFWGSLTEGLRTGKPQNEAKTGGDFFEVLYQDPQLLGQFLHAMTSLSSGVALVIARKFPWEKYRTFVDIGCAEGCLSVQVALAHPHLTGGGFDLPPVQPHFEAFVAAHSLGEELRFYPGDFLREPLPEADVLAMGRILHDWGVEEKRMLIAKAYEALPPGGALIVYDAVIDDERRRNAFGLLMSLNMLIETPGGFDYTGAECQRWLREAGFRETYVEHLVGPDSMVVGIK
ncbi:MAG TPA: methyltransferase [Thermomicrobiales bacterium]|nr:methyltransferase [Thermomicrobiales bacterium]